MNPKNLSLVFYAYTLKISFTLKVTAEPSMQIIPQTVQVWGLPTHPRLYLLLDFFTEIVYQPLNAHHAKTSPLPVSSGRIIMLSRFIDFEQVSLLLTKQVITTE